MSEVILRVKNLTKKFGNRVAVNDLSFDVFAGEIFGFLGPNGAGKTTTLKMIAGLVKPDTGNILICGYSIKNKKEKAIDFMGGFIDTPEMYKNLSGWDNLVYFASLFGKINKNKLKNIVNLVGLSDRIKDKVKTYSLGMKQRLGIAQALVNDPKLLILDEPTNGLDPSGIIEFRKFLKNIALKNGVGVLISSHNLPEMELMCDTIGIISNGCLEKTRSINQVTKICDTEQIYIKVNFPNYAGKLIINRYNPEKISIIKNTLTIAMPSDKIPEITVLLVSNGIAIYSINAITKTLEDVFLDTINKKALPPPRD